MTDTPYEYSVSRLANFGRDVSRAHSTFIKAEDRLKNEINQAVEAGVKPIKIAHDVVGRCSTRDAAIDLMSAMMAMAKMGHIPESVVEPFEEGVRVRRI